MKSKKCIFAIISFLVYFLFLSNETIGKSTKGFSADLSATCYMIGNRISMIPSSNVKEFDFFLEKKDRKKKKRKSDESQDTIPVDVGNKPEEVDSQIVTLVTNGIAPTKDKAVAIALRDAIEQAFGTFVSANTTVVNDELVRDEIATISTGNIHSYREISCINTDNGDYNVTVQSKVSVGRLVQYAQNHGMTTELAGNIFLYNRNLAFLNVKNQQKAINNLKEQLRAIASHGLYDFNIRVGQPSGATDVSVNVWVTRKPNKNMDLYIETVNQTLHSLNISLAEEINLEQFGIHTNKVEIISSYVSIPTYNLCYNGHNLSSYIIGLCADNSLDFEIYDNTGISIIPVISYKWAESIAAIDRFEDRPGVWYRYSRLKTNPNYSFVKVLGYSKQRLDKSKEEYEYYYSVLFMHSEPNNSIIRSVARDNDSFIIKLNYTTDRISQVRNISVRPHKHISIPYEDIVPEVPEK